MKDSENARSISDIELAELFNQASSVGEKLQYFGKIKDESLKIQLLDTIPMKERYKFIGKLYDPQSIAEQLSQLGEDNQRKTFNFIAKQYKGNSKRLLELLQHIDFTVVLPENMLIFNLNNLNDLSMDSLIKTQENVENSADLKFKVNEKDAEDVEYSFAELSAIIAKIEELTAGIPDDLSEVEKFYTIYYRIINNITYNHSTVNETNVELNNRREEIKRSCRSYKEISEEYAKKISKIRKDSAGLYGGLVDGKAICVGYATILQEALKKKGLKSLMVIRHSKR